MPPSAGLAGSWVQGLLFYYLTSLPAVLGVLLGHDLVARPEDPGRRAADREDPFVRWGGPWYEGIVARGYSYDPEQPSSVSYFPAYPLLGRVASWLTGLTPADGLLLVSHLSLAGAFVVAAAYAKRRSAGAPDSLPGYVLVAMGLLPSTYIFRVAYSESLFLLFMVLALYGMERRLPLILVALVVGAATATRPVGVALLVPLLLHLWHRSPTARGFVVRAGLLLPAACWGLLTYMAYLYFAFGDPLAFVKSQLVWTVRPPAPLADKLLALVTLEPVWSVLTPSSEGYWGAWESHRNPLFSLCLANPVFFLLAAALTALGAYKRWLSSYEVLLAVTLLLLSYLLRGYDYMAAAGRMSAVVFPIYLVLGRLLCLIPGPVAGALLGVSGFLMGAHAAVFASARRYPII